MKANLAVGRRMAAAEAIREFAEGPEQSQLERFALNLCRNPEEARELVQEAYYRTLKSGAYEPRGRLAAWLGTVLRNTFLDSRKRASWRYVSLHGTAPESDAPIVDVLADDSLPAGEAMEKEEAREVVQEALASLPKHYRQVVELCDLQRMAYEDAARQLGILVGTVRSRLARARAKLRRMLESY